MDKSDDEKFKEAFEAGREFARTGKIPPIKNEAEFKKLCEKRGVTLPGLEKHLNQLLDQYHNYHTIVDAVVAGVEACFGAIDNHPNARLTTFQHSCVISRLYEGYIAHGTK